MEKNIFKLKTKQLKEIAQSLQAKVVNGLEKENTEVQCIPTYINPQTTGVNGQALVLDLGGTNYRVATVDFVDGKATIHPENGWKKDLSVMKTANFTEQDLFKEQGDPISEIKRNAEMPIGYCFSYPAESMLSGDAKLLRWTKGVDIKEMIDKPIGQPLMDYLNKKDTPKFTGVKVINDTVASLFAGLTDSSYDAYIGLIVGTGTNMATFISPDKIKKLNPEYKGTGLIPVNLESGNFYPPHLTVIDDKVDACSDSKGAQRFEKAVSGMYLGEILKSAFPCDEFEARFDAQKLTSIMNYPDIHKKKYVDVSRWIYKRSAQLVAASLAGLVLVLVSHDSSIKKIRLVAEGSLFWSEYKRGKNYKKLVDEELKNLLEELGHGSVHVDITKMENANLIGSAIAALS
ncbi:hexokinase [Dysgonomonas sp. Marseille-P4677]|uniref:hexokinase family protein n=1 Tax=Dysgonomonas sp. Marseille-P4677 TaxID=2364790 RepID=UPI001911D889|nr:hexokinase [Dysgonomonas sp. Marseille-P4677]MBK5721277.1 hexokinase [Dysgonomonas sp. Marseille-P4677]